MPTSFSGIDIELIKGQPSERPWMRAKNPPHFEMRVHEGDLLSDAPQKALKHAAQVYGRALHKVGQATVTTVTIPASNNPSRVESTTAQPENRLPHHRKDAISKNTYVNKRREEEMRASKLQDAIKNGEHVGSFIQRELIEPSGRTLEFIADKLSVHWTSISYMRKGRYKLSPEMASKLSHYFGTYSTEELLTVQAAHDAKKADQAYLASLAKRDDPAPV